MKPTLVTPEIIQSYLDAGYWTRETVLDRYRHYAEQIPDAIACKDTAETYTWQELDQTTNSIAANLVDLGIPRGGTALIQMPSSCREVLLRVALKKAGIIGIFVPVQWRQKELAYVWERIDPSVIILSREFTDSDAISWLDGKAREASNARLCVELQDQPFENWIGWSDLLNQVVSDGTTSRLAERSFLYDEISLITASSGTSGLAKLCEWPEGAQVFMSRVLRDRMEISGEDTLGIFAPMSGAAGLMMWMVSWCEPCTTYFPPDYRPATLLDMVELDRISVGTTVPVILARLAGAELEQRDLSSLRLIRVGTAAANMSIAQSFEERSGCKVVIASGSMECTGFGHAATSEPKELRLNGSVGLPLESCRLRIEDGDGNVLPAGQSGELKVTAAFSSSGYWNDPEATAAVWNDGWYSTGDIGVLDDDGRLTLLGRLKDTINRSGLKILPTEIEREISGSDDVLECCVVGGPDKEYGQVPWAFVQMRDGVPLSIEALDTLLTASGMAAYKKPVAYFPVTEFPRISDNKIDKAALIETALSEAITPA